MTLNDRYQQTLEYLETEERRINEDIADLRMIYKRSTMTKENVESFQHRWMMLRLRQKDFMDDKAHLLREMRNGNL